MKITSGEASKAIDTKKITCIQYLRTTHSVANHVFKLVPLEILVIRHSSILS